MGEDYLCECAEASLCCIRFEQLHQTAKMVLYELDTEHRPDESVHGRWCEICGTADGSWPCVTKLIANDLKAALDATS